MDVVRTCCKLSRIHYAFTALSLRPHYVHARSLRFSPRPYHASSTSIHSPRRLHCILITSLRFLTRSYPVRSRFLLRPSRFMESFNHFQIKTFLQLAILSLLPLLFFFDPFWICVLNRMHLRVANKQAEFLIKFYRVMRHYWIFAHAKTKVQITCSCALTIPLLPAKSKISNLFLSSVVVQPGLNQICSQTPKTGFLMTGLINILQFNKTL